MKFDCLIIDDEKLLADSTAEYFGLFGVSARAVYSADECRAFFTENSADLLLLDINLGGESGFELCRELREKTQIPILFISARSSDDDKIVALNIGGDDYIQKPYSLGVLLAKVKAVLKRYGSSAREQYSDSRLSADFSAKRVLVNGAPVSVVMVTHDMRSARRGNRILYLKDGCVLGECDLGKYRSGDKERHEKLTDFLVRMGW